MSEQELEVTETELDETQNPAAESAEGSEVESAAPDSDGDADFEDDADASNEDEAGASDEEDADDVTGEDAEEGAEGTDVLAAAAAQATDPAEEFKSKLRRQEGDWYVIHSYAGYENRVKANLETRIQTLDMEDYIFEIQVPMEEVVEIKNCLLYTSPSPRDS